MLAFPAFLAAARRAGRLLLSDGERKLQPALQMLLVCGWHNGWICFENERTGVFVQYRKYEHPGRRGLEMSIPHNPLNRAALPAIQSAITEFGLTASVDMTDPEMPFTHVDFGEDAEEAYRFGGFLLARIYGLSPRARYRYTCDGVDFSHHLR